MFVSLKVLGQVLDPLGQQGDLHFGGTSVPGMSRVFVDDCLLFFLGQCHRFSFCTRCAQRPGFSWSIGSAADMTAVQV